MNLGDLTSLLAALCWSLANVTIARGVKGQSADNGAFLSILLTTVLALILWLAQGLQRGWPQMPWSGMLWFVLGGALTIFIGRVFFHASVQWLGAVRGSSVKRLAPFFSVLLGVTLLSEPLRGTLVLGMALIFAGFAVLVLEARARSGAASGGRLWTNPGIVYGVASAFGYAVGNVARKYGLLEIPDPALGTLVGALTGALMFLFAATLRDSYRDAVRSTFTRFNPWLLAAGLLSSAGQLLFFLAIEHTSISRAAMIASTEVFITILITLVWVRSRERISPSALAAAALGVLGTIVIMSDTSGP